MSTVLTGVASFLNTLTAPSDADSANVASIHPALQRLLDNAKYFYDTVITGRNAANGYAGLDGSSKLTAAQVPNRIVEVAAVENGAGFNTTSTTYVDITGLTTSVTAAVGDILLIHAHAPCTTTAGVGEIAIHVNDGAGVQKAMPFNSTAGSPPSSSLTWKHTVVNAGVLTIKGMLVSGSGANTASLAGNGYIAVQQIRP